MALVACSGNGDDADYVAGELASAQGVNDCRTREPSIAQGATGCGVFNAAASLMLAGQLIVFGIALTRAVARGLDIWNQPSYVIGVLTRSPLTVERIGCLS